MRYRNRGKGFIDIKPQQFVLILIGVVFVLSVQNQQPIDTNNISPKIIPRRPPKLEIERVDITPRKPPAPISTIY